MKRLTFLITTALMFGTPLAHAGLFKLNPTTGSYAPYQGQLEVVSEYEVPAARQYEFDVYRKKCVADGGHMVTYGHYAPRVCDLEVKR